ncbi:Mor transcription activator family protein [Vibrio scophthalmi]|uniref:Middle operon regulator n=1 Tax=Vibrio scophthalmi TaxID=45658 RepID=A0A1E3WME7_9VIBR|nr:Mor transcription activator family protein [Vibrio scophthalmi]ODS10944.1 Middle operon regulator [Vibrio scophthalmi]
MTENQHDMFANEAIDPKVLENLGHMSDENRNWPSLLMELNGVVANTLQLHGIENSDVSLQVTLDIGEYMGGVQVYLPRGDKLRQQIRDMKIYDEYKGNNIKHLAHKYRVTDKTIYEIIARIRKLEQQQRQPDLFG